MLTALQAYRNSDFFGLVDGLNFALQYQGKNGSVSGEGATNNGRGWSKQNGDGFGTSLTYDIWDGISAGFAYSHSKRTDEQNSVPALGRGDNAETYTGGLKYDANNIYLASQYTPDLQRNSRRFPGLCKQSAELRSGCSVPVRLRSASVCGLPAV